MQEIWKDVKGYEGIYKVSNYGRVLSVERKNARGQTVKQRIKATKPNNRGYIQICLTKGGQSEYKLLHRIVAEAFILNPQGLPQVNHKDENKNNNRADNLEWCTNLYNRHYGTGLERAMRNHNYDEIAFKNRKYVAQKDDTGHVIAVWHGLIAAAEAVGGNKDAIRNSIRRGQRSSGYYWCYTAYEPVSMTPPVVIMGDRVSVTQ